jgi:ABC-2 type transport system permease protein
MPIHDQGYRRYAGPRRPPGRGWAVIAGAGIRALVRRRVFIGLLIGAWIPFVVRAVQVWASTNLPQVQFLAATPQMFRDFLEQQQIFFFFMTVYAGAGLIANDRRANALQIYLSKPLTRLEYVAGKMAILMAFLLLVSWVPAMLLLVVQVAFSGSFEFLGDNLSLVPAITVFSMVQVVTVSSAMLALSSLSRSSRYVGVLYAGLLFFSQALYGVVYALTRDSAYAWISLRSNLAQVGDVMFGLSPRFDMPVAVAWVVIVSLIVASGVVLARRVRAIEIVT